MAAFEPTASQKLAIEDRGGELLVSAAAGSGKTRVLTERLMSWMTQGERPASVEDFLVITFSTAAAAELRGRISEELERRRAEEPGSKRLRREAALVRRAPIETIHGFCAAVLREYASRAGLDPDFAIADEDRAAELRRLALETALESAYAAGEPEFLALADSVGAGRDDRRLAELVLRLHDKLQAQARPEDWAREQAELFSAPAEDAGETPWGRELLDGAAEELDYWASELESLAGELEGHEKLGKAYSGSFAGTAQSLRSASARAREGWDSLRAALPVDFPRLGSVRGGGEDPELAAAAKARREACKKAAKRLERDFSQSSAELLRDMRAAAPAMRALLRLVMDFDAEYTRRKRRRSLLDFSDLEHLAARLLTETDGSPTETARELSRRYREVMVDEYQDVSAVQDLIIRAVSDGGRRLFMVGDVKQSIYRFRLADPTIFLEKYEKYADAPQPEGVPRRVFLRESFRSRPEVVDAVNAVFGCLMSKGLGELDYDERAALRAGLEHAGVVPVPELVLVPTPGAEEGEERPDKTAVEAAQAARMMRRLVEGGARVMDGGSPRPLGYGDIAVLLRSVNVSGPAWRRALSREGVPVEAGSSGGFFESAEVSVMLSLLALIDNPRQDVALVSVLSSALFGFSADELTRIRLRRPEGDLYAALRSCAGEDAKVRDFLERLDGLRDLARDAELAELLREVCGRLMSIHRSKGLEFPVVFIGGTARSFNLADTRESVLMHPQLGLGPKLTDAARGIEYPTLARRAVARRLERELLSEELRLLYVAMTRARERLFITCALPDPEARIEKLAPGASARMPAQALLAMRCAADWLISAALGTGCRALNLSIAAPDGELDRVEVKNTRPQAAEPETGPEEESPAVPDLAARLDWIYPHRGAERLPSKLTATELKSLDGPDEEAAPLLPRTARRFRKPELEGAGRRLDAAERGTAAHLALRYLDLGRIGSAAEARAELDRLAAEGRLSPLEAGAVDAAALARFAASEIGRKIASSPRVLREFPFALLCGAERFFAGAEGEELLLQGVVDCCIVEDDGLTIVDYKTDAVSAAAAPERALRYAPQLEAYAWAMSRVTGLPVKRRVVCFLASGASVEL